jgi:hypothetical protein
VNKNSTDAVNGSQLYGLSQSAANIFGGTTVVDNEGNLSSFSFTNYEGDTFNDVTSVLKANDRNLNLINETFDMKSDKNKGTVKKETVFSENVTMNKDLTVSGTFTSNGPAVFNDTVTMNKGLSMGGTKITNLAPGTEENDAATYGQVKSVSDRVDNLATNMDNGLRRVGARAAALAGLHPLPYDEDAPTTFTAAVGNYRGHTSAAVGVMHHFDRDTLLSVAGTIGDEPMINAGISLRLGRYDEQVIEARKRRRKEQAEKNRLIGQISTQAAQLEAQKKEIDELKSQKKELDELKKRLNALEKKQK